MAKIKSIVFDMGGVVVGPFLGDKLVEYASPRLGIREKELLDLIKIYEPDLQKGKFDHVTAWKKVLSHKNKKVSDRILKTLRLAPYKKAAPPNKDVVELINKLRKKYIVGLISNTQEPHVSYNRSLGLYDLFDICILSCEVGMRKPDKEIFELYMKKTGLKPKEIVFIDDEKKLLVNVKKLGITPIHFQGVEKLKNELNKLGVKLVK
jgi:glucose-1-phosphatase